LGPFLQLESEYFIFGHYIFIINVHKVLYNFMARARYTIFAGFEHRGTVDWHTSNSWNSGDKVSLLYIIVKNHIHLYYSIQSLSDQLACWTSASCIVHQGPFPSAEYFVVDNIFKSTVHQIVNKFGIWCYSIPLFFGMVE
jgi:hypothetical protein